LGGAIVFLLSAVFQYRNYRRTSLRWSLLAACCFLLGVVIFVVDALSKAGWEPARRLTCM
jgi:hypothetical protein